MSIPASIHTEPHAEHVANHVRVRLHVLEGTSTWAHSTVCTGECFLQAHSGENQQNHMGPLMIHSYVFTSEYNPGFMLHGECFQKGFQDKRTQGGRTVGLANVGLVYRPACLSFCRMETHKALICILILLHVSVSVVDMGVNKGFCNMTLLVLAGREVQYNVIGVLSFCSAWPYWQRFVLTFRNGNNWTAVNNYKTSALWYMFLMK